MAEPQDEEALRIDRLSRDARLLDLPKFREKYGDGFLVHDGPLEPRRRAQRPQRTMAVNLSKAPDALAPGPAPSSSWLVFPVRHTGRSPYPRIITVGRTKNNDIILADIVVSKFHALFKEEDGMFLLQDADSRNGTFLNGSPVPTTKHGKPVLVKPGAKVRIGMIDLWFVDAVGLKELAMKSVP